MPKKILYKRFLSNPSPEKEGSYKRYKKKWNHSVRTAKRLYYEKKVEQLKSNIKRTLSSLNEIVNRKRRIRQLLFSFQADSQGVSDPNQIVDLFCN